MHAVIFALAAQLFTLQGSAPHAYALWVSGPAPAPAAGTYEMHNVNRTFSPPFLIVPIHSRVRFPNDDPFYHSIYSAGNANAFDIGYYDTGPGKFVTFDHPGIVPVRCHIHAYMHGTIAVADGPYAAVENGRYAISGLPAGTYTVHEITDRSKEKSFPLVLKSDKTLNL